MGYYWLSKIKIIRDLLSDQALERGLIIIGKKIISVCAFTTLCRFKSAYALNNREILNFSIHLQIIISNYKLNTNHTYYI